MEKTILHSDMNNFFASVSCIDKPELKEKPVAVCGDPAMRHGIILAKNEVAKKFGVATGEPIWKSIRKCSSLILLPAEFDKYKYYSDLAIKIYYDYTDRIEPFGIDECWLDVTGSRYLFGDGETIAHTIRKRIKSELGLTVSVGCSFNKTFAKLASDVKKPDAVTCINKSDFKKTVWNMPVSNLLFAGRSTTHRLKQNGYYRIGDLASASPEAIGALLGKNGIKLWQCANGLDDSPVSYINSCRKIKSIGNGITMPFDIDNAENAKAVLYTLCEKVSYRLYKHGFLAKSVQLGIKDSNFEYHEHRARLSTATFSSFNLFDCVYLLLKNNFPNKPVRSLTVRAGELSVSGFNQISMLPEEIKTANHESIDSTVFKIRNRYGNDIIQRALLLNNKIGCTGCSKFHK